jgi:hypothetical protein
MKSEAKFYGLNGAKNVSRAEILDIIELAKNENNCNVVYRLSKILNSKPDADYFNIEIVSYPKTGLNGAQHTGDYKEALDDCGRLKKGYRFVAGKVVKVAPKVVSNDQKKTKKTTTKVVKLKTEKPKTTKKQVVKEKDNDQELTKENEKCKLGEETKIYSKTENEKISREVLEKLYERDANKKEPTSIVGYMLKDSISGEIVASKKELKDLETVYYNLEENEIGKDLEIFVYQIIKKKGKNTQGKRIIVDWKRIEVKPSTQLKLLAPKKKPALKSPAVENNSVAKNTLAYRLQNKKNVKHEYYKIVNKDIADFLGNVEKKTKESVAITIAGGQGSMKTRLCFQLMNDFAQNYKVGHASIEEHPESALYENKIHQYLNAKALHNISAPEINSIDDVHKLVRENDVIIIDSFSKLQEMQKGCELDKDFRKAYDGKLFIIIYQLTGDGKMRGGSKSQFDGDIISFIQKETNYKDNYCYHDKNRYNNRNLEDLKFNIFSGKLIQPEQEQQQKVKTENIEFSFNVK